MDQPTPQQPLINTNEIEPPTNAASMAEPPASKKKSHKKGVIATVVSVIVVLLLVGGGCAYAFWYQNPDRVVATSLMKAVSADTVVATTDATITPHDSKDVVTLKVDSQADANNAKIDLDYKAKTDGKEFGASVSTVTSISDNSFDYFFKIDGIAEAIAAVDETDTASALYGQIFAPLDSKWIAVSTDDLKLAQGASGVAADIDQECVAKLMSTASSDKSYKKELADLYLDKPFVQIIDDLGSKDGNLGYSVKLNHDNLVAFIENIRDTKLYSSYRDCMSTSMQKEFDKSIDKAIKDAAKEQKYEKDTVVELWIDRWSHNLKKVHIDTSDDTISMAIDAEMQFNTDVSIEVPSDAKSIKDIYTDFMKAYIEPTTESTT